MAKDSKSVKIINKGGPLGGAYFVTFIGAAVYFIQKSDGFIGLLYALLKACVWPGIVLYHVLTILKV